MTDSFHHKHPYLTVLILLIILLVVSDFVRDITGLGRPHHRYSGYGGHHYGEHYRGGSHHGGSAMACGRGDAPFVAGHLLMGRGGDGGTAVSDADWQQFVNDEIRPRLPRGFSVFHIDGYSGDGDGGFYSEQSVMLYLLHDGSERDTLEAIGDAYREKFNRGFVLHAENFSCVRFDR